MTPTQLANVIRFHLGELSARNGHHEFEHLCRYLARARICSNILPATGPVGAGGDQGRDFETFKSQLTHPAVPTYKNRTSNGAVAFACSLEKRIESKIRRDVKSIVEGGPVDEIVYFCECNLAIAKRHKLQAWAKSSYVLELQIFDGAAISELLAERDVFWIAQEFLHIPAETMPAAPDQDEWYAEHLERWLSRSPVIFSSSDFGEIKLGLRRATFHDDARSRLPFWIGLMERFVDSAAPRPLQRSAIYELAIAHLRGKGDMTSQLAHIRSYYGDAAEWLMIADLQNSATLIVYAFGGWALKQFAVDPSELFAWRRKVQSELDQQIEEAPGHGRKSGLLNVRGFLQIVPKDAGTEPPLDQAFDDWERMLDEAELSPLFPIEEFAGLLSKITPQMGRHPRFEALADRADKLLAKRKGPAAAAEKTFERALAFYERGELLEAIRDLHRVHHRWFTGDSMARFQRATLVLANCYLELGLAYAAKNVALAGAFVAKHSDGSDVAHTLPTLLFTAADTDDGAGNSLSYLHMLLLAVDAHLRLDADPLQTDKHPAIQTNFGQVAALRGLAMRSGAAHLAAVDEALAAWPEPLRDPILKTSLDPTGFWLRGSWEDVWRTLEGGFIDKPFGDLGASRAVSWRALNIRWTATFENDYATTGVAEEFIAALQIALVTLADVDLCLLPQNVEFHLSISRKARHPKIARIEERSDPTGVKFEINLAGAARGSNPLKGTSGTLAIVAELLGRTSVIPTDTLSSAIKGGLIAAASRVHIARPYRELYNEFALEAQFDIIRRGACTPFQADRQFNGRQSPLLSPRDGPGPTYSRREALEGIKIRYEKSMKCAGFTVQALMADAGRQAILSGWHQEGMRDWEILSIIANAANNIRHPLSDTEESSIEQIERHRAAFDIAEQAESALGPDVFPDELLRLSRRLFQVAHLRSWKLDVPSAMSDEKAIEAFLISRYALRSDDLDHVDFFRWQDCDRASDDHPTK